MANLPMENLGRFGLQSDKAPYELQVEAWSRADNIRFNQFGAQKMTGHKAVLPGMLHPSYWLFPWVSSTGFSWLYLGLTRWGRIVGSGHSDVTRFTSVLGDDDYASTLTTLWSAALLGDLPIVTYSESVDPPQSWNATNSRFENLPNWPAATFADMMVVQNNFAVALRVKKSAVVFNPRMVKWSEPADPGTYPNSWDETDPTKLTGEVTLADTPGEIMAAAQFGPAMLIYKEDSVVAMRHVQGQNVFDFKTIFSEFGALSQEAVGVLENSHFVVTDGDVIVHNGQTFKSVIDKINRNFLFQNMSATLAWKTQVKVYIALTEVWICYAGSGSAGQLDRALIWNYTDNTWASRDLQEFAYIASGFVDTNTLSQVIDNQAMIIDTNLDLIDQQPANPVFDELLAADASNTKLVVLNTSEQFDGVNFTARLERSGLPIIGRDREGNWRTDLDSRKFIRRVHPKLEANGSIDFYVGGQEFPDSGVNWVGPFSFDSTQDRYFDCMVNTRFFAIRLESSLNVHWNFFGYTLDLDVIGEANG